VYPRADQSLVTRAHAHASRTRSTTASNLLAGHAETKRRVQSAVGAAGFLGELHRVHETFQRTVMRDSGYADLL
jgi:hypothetical protein